MITLSGDVEPNPKTLSVCHWNFNSICAHNFAKLPLLRAHVSVHKFDIICLSETYLDSGIDNESLKISECYLIRSDHPSNKKRGGICIYYKNFLPLKVTGVRLLEECIAFDLIISNKLCSFVALYRSPSQSQDDFATFSDNFEMTQCSTFDGISIENITPQLGLRQIINESTHILENSSSCIDLIFTAQTNLSVESGTHPSLHPYCHHQITYAKFNLEVLYTPPYTREI